MEELVPTEFEQGHILIGLKQSQKAVAEGRAKKAYVALDAEERVRTPFIKLCAANDVAVVDVSSMGALGEACKIDVGAAVVVELL